jgi:hypothetical protein
MGRREPRWNARGEPESDTSDDPPVKGPQPALARIARMPASTSTTRPDAEGPASHLIPRAARAASCGPTGGQLLEHQHE